MPLESATYLNNLVVSNPSSSDLMSQADDHIRMLKSVLQNTFPNVNGPITSTPHQLNNAVVPVGGIIMWSGSPAALPTGWRLCDGGTYAKSDGSGPITVPDLREKFVVGCGGTNSVPLTAPTVGTTGGAASVTPTITVTNEAVALTQAQIPAHNHAATVTDPGHLHTINDPGHTHSYTRPASSAIGYPGGASNDDTSTANTASATTGITIVSNTTGITVATANTGSGATHIHNNTATSSSLDNRPPFYTLAFIIKV